MNEGGGGIFFFNSSWGGEVAQCQRVRVSVVCYREIDGLHKFSSICFKQVNNSLTISVSPTCSSQCRRLVQRRPCHVIDP